MNNPTCLFCFCCNYSSQKDYTDHFLPFAQEHGIPPRFGISAHENYLTWIYTANGDPLHSSLPGQASVLGLRYLLAKMRGGADVEEMHSVSLVLNEVLYEKYDQQRKNKQLSNELQPCKAHAFSLISQIVLEEWGKLINRPEYPAFCGDKTFAITQQKRPNFIQYYSDPDQDIHYAVVFENETFSIRLVRRLSLLKEKKDAWIARTAYLKEKNQ